MVPLPRAAAGTTLVRSLLGDSALATFGDAVRETDVHERNALDHAVLAGPSTKHRECAMLLLTRTDLALDLSREHFAPHGEFGARMDDSAVNEQPWREVVERLHVAVRARPCAGGRAHLKHPIARYCGRYVVRSNVDDAWRLKLADDTSSTSTSTGCALKFFTDEKAWKKERRMLEDLRRHGGNTAPRLLGHFEVDKERGDPLSHDREGRPFTHALVLEEGTQVRAGTRLGSDRMHNTAKVALAYRLLHCVDALHQLGEVHCDIKPANFLIEGVDHAQSNEYLLADYDAAEEIGAECLPSYTPPYCAPEVAAAVHAGRPDAQRVRVGLAIDVWALALVLFEIFARQPLMRGVFPEARADASTAEEALDNGEVACRYVEWLAGEGGALLVERLERAMAEGSSAAPSTAC